MAEEELKNWQDIPIGGIILESGNSEQYETGSWRAFRPVVDHERCTNCLTCWAFCPDSAISADQEGNLIDPNMNYCKGCGMCAQVCPVKCIEMVEEANFTEEVA